jgi:ABC-type sugar transport system substrate-binding protein
VGILHSAGAKALAILGLAMAIVACNSSSGPPGGHRGEGAPRIAVVVSTLNNPWFVVLANTARDEAQKRGYAATIFDSQNDPAKEAANFENIVASGYSAVLFSATDTKGSVANALRATRAGVPVFTMDREIASTEAAVSQVLSDNYAGAVTEAQYFVAQLDEHGRYVELLGIVGDNNTWNRSKGFHSVVDRYPGFKMVAQQTAEFDRSRALEVMESILQAQPDIDAVFCGNDAMALGAYQALLGAGRADKVKVFGFRRLGGCGQGGHRGKNDCDGHAISQGHGAHGGGIRRSLPQRRPQAAAASARRGRPRHVQQCGPVRGLWAP